MKKILTLTKVMSRNYLDSLKTVQTNRRKNESKLKHTLKLISMGFLFVYLLGLVFVPTHLIIKNLVKWGQPSLAISALNSFAPVIMLYFVILSVPGVFYFSSDIEDFLPLPLKAYEIITAKYLTAYLQTLIGSLIFFLPVFINYFILAKPGLLFIPLALIVLLLIPIIPLALALVITSLIMRFMPFFKNKNLYTYLTTSLVFIPTFFIVFFMNKQDFDTDPLMLILQSIQNMDDSIFRSLNLFFPTSNMMTLGLIDKKIHLILLAFIISMGVTLMALWVINSLYFDSVIGIDETSSKKRKLHLTEFDRYIKKHSFKVSFMIQDFKRILRTPSFAINYLSMFIIMPLMGVIPLFTQGSIPEIIKVFPEVSRLFHEFFYSLDALKQFELVLGVGIIFGLMMANFEMSSSTAISREGLALKNYLSMPIKLSDIVHAKALFSMILSTVFGSVYVILTALILKPKFLTLITFLVGTYIGITLVTYIAILMDVLFPSLNWSTEQEAIKGNLVQVLVILPIMIVPMGFVWVYDIIPSFINVGILLLGLPFLTFILIRISTKAANHHLLNKIQNI